MTKTHIASSEVTTLDHEVGDDAVESRLPVAFTGRSLAELTKVLGGLGDILIEEVKHNTADLGCHGTKQDTVSKKNRKYGLETECISAALSTVPRRC